MEKKKQQIGAVTMGTLIASMLAGAIGGGLVKDDPVVVTTPPSGPPAEPGTFVPTINFITKRLHGTIPFGGWDAPSVHMQMDRLFGDWPEETVTDATFVSVPEGVTKIRLYVCVSGNGLTDEGRYLHARLSSAEGVPRFDAPYLSDLFGANGNLIQGWSQWMDCVPGEQLSICGDFGTSVVNIGSSWTIEALDMDEVAALTVES